MCVRERADDDERESTRDIHPPQAAMTTRGETRREDSQCTYHYAPNIFLFGYPSIFIVGIGCKLPVLTERRTGGYEK